MAAIYVPPYFLAHPNDRYYSARTLARICALGECSELKRFLQTSKLRVRQPLDLGCEPFGWSPLMFACNYLNTQNIQLLLKWGAIRDLDFCTQDGMTLLMAIVVASNPDNEAEAILCADMLFLAHLKVSAVSARFNNGRNALTMAVFKGSRDLVQFLINKGANPNERDGYGETPFNIAVSENMRLMTDLLYAAGSNPFMRNLDGQMCLELASEYAPQMQQHVTSLLSDYFQTKFSEDRVRFNSMLVEVNGDVNQGKLDSASKSSMNFQRLISSCFVGVVTLVIVRSVAKLVLRK